MATPGNKVQSTQRPGNYPKSSQHISEMQGDGKVVKRGPHAGKRCIAYKDGKECGARISESNTCPEPICRPCQQRLREVAMDHGMSIENLAKVSDYLRRMADLKRESAA